MRLVWLVMFAACGGSGGAGGGDDGVDTDAGNTVDAYAGPTTMRTYQQGLDGYTGTRSVGISTYGGLGNVGEYNANGMTFADGQNDWCTGIDIPSGTYSEVWLLRFEDLGIAPGTPVASASLTINGYGDGSSGLFFAGSYVKVGWFGNTPESCAGCSSAVGWRYANGTGAAWGALGAGASGTDTISGKAFRLPETGEAAAFAPTEYTAALDPAVVQSWVDGQNNGVRIVAGVSGHHMGYVQAQRNGGRPTSMRPRLTIMLATP